MPSKKKNEEEKKNETIEEKQANYDAQRWQKAQEILSTVRDGWSIAITRVRPAWCSGYLEKIELSSADSDGIDMDYLVETWGGEILRIRLSDERNKYRGQADIKLRQWPPRHKGQRIYRSDFLEDDFEQFKNRRSDGQPGQTIIQQPPMESAPQIDWLQMWEMMQKTRKEDLGMLQALYGNRAPASGQLPPSQNPIHGRRALMKDMVDMATQYKMMREVFGGGKGENAEPVNEETQLLQTIGDVAKAIGFNRLNQNPAQHQTKGPVKAGPARVVPPNGAGQQARVVPPNGQNGPSVSDSTNTASQPQVNTEHFVDNVLLSLSKLSDNEREAVFQSIENRTGMAFIPVSELEPVPEGEQVADDTPQEDEPPTS